VNERTDAVLAAIDGALMDPEMPDGMRWSPEPEKVPTGGTLPYDGEVVPIPPQHYELNAQAAVADYDRAHAAALDRLRAHDALHRITGRVQYRHPGGEWEDAVLSPDGWRPAQPENQRGPDLITHVQRQEDALIEAAARHWRTGGTLTPESTAALGDSIREAMRADLHRRAERIQADARAALPRVTASPRVAVPIPANMPAPVDGLLIVEEYASGLTTVRRPTNEEVGELLADTMRRLVEAVTPIFEAVGSAFSQIGRALFGAADATRGAAAELDTPEARRAAALAARRTRPTGPALAGPEASRRPRSGPSPATTPRGRQRPRQGRER
jgi:hypothetical protein